MSGLRKSQFAMWGMFGGFALGILLAATVGRYFPPIPVVGILMALGCYAAAVTLAKCPGCGEPVLWKTCDAFTGFFNMLKLTVGAHITCGGCGRTSSPNNEV